MPQVGDLTGLPAGAGSAGPASGLTGQSGPAGQVTPVRTGAAAEILGLQAGDLVDALLVEDLGGGTGIVDLQGKLFRAVFPEGLQAGARVPLRVAGTGPPLLLQLPTAGEEGLIRLLSPPATGLAQTVRGLLAAAADPAAAPELRALLQGAEFLRLPSDPDHLAPAFARFLSKSGLFHEALLARGEDPGDLKALALRLLSSSKEPTLTRLAESLLGHIEAHQARSTVEGTVIVPFVLPWAEDTVRGEWVVEERTGCGSKGEALAGALRLRLDMPHLGAVEVALRWGPAGNSVRLRLDPGSLDAVASRLPELEQALTAEPGARLLELKAEPLVRAPGRTRPGLLEVVA